MKPQEINFKYVSNSELISRMEKLVRSERKITHLVLVHIAEVEARKLYADLGYDCMYTYLTRGLGYSESSAYRRLQSARFLKQLPENAGTEVADRLEEGRLNLTQLSQVQKSVKESQKQGNKISTEKTLEILNKLENQNAFSTEKILAQEMGRPIQTQEKIRPQKDESVRLELTLTQEQFRDLEQAKSLLSHVCPEGSWSEVIAMLVRNYNQKKLGIEKTKKTSTRSNTATRKYISVRTKRALMKRAGFCCEYRNAKSGTRCESRYQLEVEHCQPLALGGSDEFENLRILCRAHNSLAARRAGLSRE